MLRLEILNSFSCCSVVQQRENGWGDEDFEVEAILDQTVSEVW